MAARAKDETGNRHGTLTVLGRIPRPSGATSRGALWCCRCDCGQIVEVTGVRLRSGRPSPCGCIKRTRKPASHGLSPQAVSAHAPALTDRQWRLWAKQVSQLLPPHPPSLKQFSRLVEEAGIDPALTLNLLAWFQEMNSVTDQDGG